MAFLVITIVVVNISSALFVANKSLYTEQIESQSLRVRFVEQNAEFFDNEDTYYLINDTTYVSWLRFKLKFHMPYEELYTVETEEFDNIPNGALVIIAANKDYSPVLTRQLIKIGYGNDEFELCRKVSDE